MEEIRETGLSQRSSKGSSMGCNMNMDYLIELSGGDTEFIVDIVQMFINDAPDVLHQSQTYLKNNDFELLKITVHKLKSSVQIMGNNELAELIQTIETNCADEAKHGEVPPMLITMHREVTAMANYLKEELPKLAA